MQSEWNIVNKKNAAGRHALPKNISYSPPAEPLPSEYKLEDVTFSDAWCIRAHGKSKYKNTNVSIRKKQYSGSIIVCGSFSTIPNMWRYLNNIPFPQKTFGNGDKMYLDNTCTNAISIFSGTNLPEWENYQKGDAIFEFRLFTDKREIIWDVWLQLILSVVGRGELIKHDIIPGNVIGIRLVDKTGIKSNNHMLGKFEVWCLNVDKECENNIKKFIHTIVDGSLYTDQFEITVTNPNGKIEESETIGSAFDAA